MERLLFGQNFEGYREDGSESRSSGSDNLEGVSGDEQAPMSSQMKKKYHRHTRYQIQELESFFKDNPHPDEKERLALGKKLNLESKQVKFWFQNRRTQKKAHMERHENAILKQEINKLRIENIAVKEAIRNPLCNNCGGHANREDTSMEGHHLMIENTRLRDELNRITTLANRFLGRPISSPLPNSNLELAIGRNGYGGLDYNKGVLNGSYEKSKFLDLALSAMAELVKLGQVNDPLWIGNINGGGESLDLDEYSRAFRPCLGMKPHGFVSDASRASSVVMISSLSLVDALLDANRWREMFVGMVGSSSIVEVVSGGTGGDSRNGVLQLMEAEIQVVSPLVPIREVRFIRFCRQQAEGIWVIVDVSVNAGRERFMSRRLPSGCIIHDMPNGYSKVTWIEHTEYDESAIHHHYRSLIRSGLGFGAQRWISMLQRHCDCLAAIMVPATTLYDKPGSRRSLTSLAHRMTSNFCGGVCGTGGHKWEVVSTTPEAARIMIDRSRAVLTATMSVRMPVAHQRLFTLLLKEEHRSRWDVLSHGNSMTNLVRFAKGQDSENPNCVSILRVNSGGPMMRENIVLVLQETSSDVTGSLIVYAAIDPPLVSVVMNGQDSSSGTLLPSGFAIVPDCVAESGAPHDGSLLTVGFQILVNDLTSSKLTMESVETVNNLMARTVQGVKDVVDFDQRGSS